MWEQNISRVCIYQLQIFHGRTTHTYKTLVSNKVHLHIQLFISNR